MSALRFFLLIWDLIVIYPFRFNDGLNQRGENAKMENVGRLFRVWLKAVLCALLYSN